MNFIIFLFKIFIFKILFKLYSSEEPLQRRYISIPFNIKVSSPNKISNSQSFIDNYYSKNIILEFSIGKNSQIVNGILDQENSCFEFIDKNLITNLDNINIYSPKKSESFDIRKEKIYHTYEDDEIMAIGSDIFNFNKDDKYNISFLFLKTINENEINYEEIKNKQYISKIGLKLLNQESHFDGICPQFFQNSKKIANLSKYIISFEFNDVNKGNFIFGDELFNYNEQKYYESQYIGTYSSTNHQIYFNQVHLIDKNKNKINITEGTYATFNYNNGVIIGTSIFQKKINETFFDLLIKDNICKNNIVQYNNIQYNVYSCEEKNFKDKLISFPKIFFVSKSFEYNFELNYSDLFINLGSIYYFLIIFQINESKNGWIFGQPFFKKFNFTINLDENWVGFYNPDKPIIKKEDNNKNNPRNNKTRKIIIIISLVLFVIGLALGMFFLGKKMKNDRKKRANELMDDNYDYSVGINS